MNEREHDTGAPPPRVDGVEYRFRIDAYTPETIPMARLGEYITQLALILGEPASVHFVGLDAGSTVLRHRIEREAVPKVGFRVQAIRTGDAPRDALRAYRTMNRLLREDNGVGSLTEPTSGVLLDFPGRDETEEPATTVRQDGTVDGQLTRVGGVERDVPIILTADGEQVVGCYADRHVAKQLAGRLFEHVRLYGSGRWRRDGTGDWSLVDFKVRNFEVLHPAALSAVLADLRGLGAEFATGAYEELDPIRHGTGREDDGRD